VCMIYIRSAGAEGFEWDAFNVGHIARHGVQPPEAEEALAGDARTIRSVVSGSGEERWLSVGSTSRGRLLAVVWTVRGTRVRVVTAYAADKRLQRFYERAKFGNSSTEAGSPIPDRG
jgi:uncharacterized protein